MNDFVHLHVHTEYSLLDGAARLDKLIDKAVSLGQTALAITDHGVMYGVAEFYKKAVAKNIKPIIGCEVYVAPSQRTIKSKVDDFNYNHLVLLAKNNVGYKNLLNIVSDAFINGFYYKPRTDIEFLKSHSEGIIALSACFAGSVQRCILQDDMQKAKECALELNSIFKDGFYLEIQNHFLDQDQKIIDGILKLSEQTGVPVVATNDVHYVEKQDSYIQQILTCIGTNRTFDQNNPLGFETDEFYLKSSEQMKQMFSFAPFAISNTVKIADMCNVTLDFDTYHLPKFKTPQNIDSFDLLHQKCADGLIKRYGDKSHIDRVEYELSVIKKMGFVDYFLIVADFVNYAKNNDIAVGPGRGSATGSIVSYCLGITDIDPIKYNLIFERFLNPGRASMPDIDIDFCVERRNEIITYLTARYGIDSVTQIITFGTLAARAAIRDVGRVLSIPYSTVESIVKYFPAKPGTTIMSVLEKDDDLSNRYRNDADIKKLLDTAMAVEGFARHGSTHAAGVVITNGPTQDFLPLAKNDDIVVTQYQKTEVEQLGFLKIDLLGLRNITVIDKTEKLIKQSNPDFNIEAIPEDDAKTFEMLGNGNTFGVFQLESEGMRKMLTKLKPRSIDDIIVAVSLYRPGPMDSIPKYLENRKNPERIKYKTSKLKPILESTFGCIVYQEQVMQIARELAGYTYEHADNLRAAMSKKKYDIMQNERKLFIEGCVLNGISKNVASSIFDEMSEFARYGFNKSHAAGYALIAYRTAYLKANYTPMFMASLMSSVMYNTQKLKEYISECTRMGITVCPPNINKSCAEFVSDGKNVYYGIAAIKNVGNKFAKAIDTERRLNGNFKDFNDFVLRLPANDITRRAIENMISCGVFDCFGYSRRHMLSVYEMILSNVLNFKRIASENQISFFEEDVPVYNDYYSNPMPEFELSKKLALEKDSLGLYISDNPLKRFLPIYDSNNHTLVSKLNSVKADTKTKIFGLIDSVKLVTTKQLKDMAYVKVEDISSTVDVVFFPRQFDAYKAFLDVGACVEIEGTVSQKDEDTVQFVCNVAKFPNPDTLLEKHKKLYLNFESANSNAYNAVIRLLEENKGNNTCVFHFKDTNKTVSTAKKLCVNISYSLIDDLKQLLGDKNVVVK